MKKSITPFELKKILSNYNEFTLTCFDGSDGNNCDETFTKVFVGYGAAPYVTFRNDQHDVTIHDYFQVLCDEKIGLVKIDIDGLLLRSPMSSRVRRRIICK